MNLISPFLKDVQLMVARIFLNRWIIILNGIFRIKIFGIVWIFFYQPPILKAVWPFFAHYNVAEVCKRNTGKTSPFFLAKMSVDIVSICFLTSIIRRTSSQFPFFLTIDFSFPSIVMYHASQCIRSVPYWGRTKNNFGSFQRIGVNGNSVLKMPRSINSVVHSYSVYNQQYSVCFKPSNYRTSASSLWFLNTNTTSIS